MQVYADDTVLYCFSSSIETIQDSLNTDLMAIAEWLNANKLTLNLEKSKFMLFGSEKKLKSVQRPQVMSNKSTWLNHFHTWESPSPPI